MTTVDRADRSDQKFDRKTSDGMTTTVASFPDKADAWPATVHVDRQHLVFRDVLGSQAVAALLDHVSARQVDFRPKVLRNRETGKNRVDRERLDGVYLSQVGACETAIAGFVRGIAPRAITELRLNEPDADFRECEISAYADGGHFCAHIDTDERVGRVRILSCVYYFAMTPRRFYGGELRLYGFPTLSAEGRSATASFVDVTPETDTLVVFPSWLRHEVLPVRVPSRAWMDSRFTINCWIHRAGAPEAVGSGGRALWIRDECRGLPFLTAVAK
jgi:SM-20-related protein